MNWEAMFPGKYMKSSEFAGKKPTLTIKAVKLEELPDEKTGGTRKRGVLYFEETPKAFVANRTNATAIKLMFGPETDAWIGKRISLWAAPFTDPFTGEQITAIRVLGSPDIDKQLTGQGKIGRKHVQFRLVKTPDPRARANGKAAAPAEPAPPPAEQSEDFDPDTGEVLAGATPVEADVPF